jgi:hypothetical protein
MKKLFLLGVGILGMPIILKADSSFKLQNGDSSYTIFFIFRYKDKAAEDHYTLHQNENITISLKDTDFHYIGAWANQPDGKHISGSLTSNQIDQIKKYPKRTWTIEAEPDNHYEKLIMNLSFQT